MDVTERRATLKANIAAMEKALSALKRQLADVEEQYQKEVGRSYYGVTIKTRQASYVLIAPSGLSVTMSRTRNAYNERNVYWYTGKKGALALEATRWNSNRIAKWLAEQVPAA